MALKKAEIKQETEAKYIRIGCDYFKVIQKNDRYGIKRPELKKWNKDEIKIDHGQNFLFTIEKYDDFIIEPDNKNYKAEIDNCYNLYKPFVHKSKKGEWKWTKILLEHIFEEQLDIGLIYLQVMYLFPRQALPVLALVSEERETGKSTFIDWLYMVFGANMVLINPHDLTSDFNGIYATANIIAIEETVVEKSLTVEKVKSISTQKMISTNIKNVQNFMLPFFGKIIMASNNERKFIKIDKDEIRFWVRKLKTPKINNKKILDDMIEEIPYFLNYLESIPTPDFTKSRQVLTPEQIDNDSLKIVKHESRPWLASELEEMFKDLFNNSVNQMDVMKATQKEIKERFFANNSQISGSYIGEILQNFFKFSKSETNIAYRSLDNLEKWKTGTPFLIEKSTIFGEKGIEKGENNQKNDLFEQFVNHKKEMRKIKEQLQIVGMQVDMNLDVDETKNPF